MQNEDTRIGDGPPPPPPPPPLPALTTAATGAKAHEPQILRMIRELRETIQDLRRKQMEPRDKPQSAEATAGLPASLAQLKANEQVSILLLFDSRIAIQQHRLLRKARRDLNRGITVFMEFNIKNARHGSDLNTRILASIIPLEIELKSLPPKLAELIYLHAPGTEPPFPLRRYSVASSYNRFVNRRKALLAALETTKTLTADTPQELWAQLESRMFTKETGHLDRMKKFLKSSIDLKLGQDDFVEDLTEQEKNLALLAEFRGVKLKLVRSSVRTTEVPVRQALVALGVSDTELQEDFYRHLIVTADQIQKQALVAYLTKSTEILNAMWRYYEDLRAKDSARQLSSLIEASNNVLNFYRRVLGYRRRKAPFFGPKGLTFRVDRPLQKLLLEDASLIGGLQDVINEITSELRQRLPELDVMQLKVSEEMINYTYSIACDVCGGKALLACADCKNRFYCSENCQLDDLDDHYEQCDNAD